MEPPVQSPGRLTLSPPQTPLDKPDFDSKAFEPAESKLNGGSKVFEPAEFKSTGSGGFPNLEQREINALLSVDTHFPPSVPGPAPAGVLSPPETPESPGTDIDNADPLKDAHKSLLCNDMNYADDADEMLTAPIFTEAVRGLCLGTDPAFKQHGLLAGNINGGASLDSNANWTAQSDPRIFFNIAAPSSVFICGSQGSGKSHTLSCLLENCLLPSEANTLPRPLTGLVFHYDGFISEIAGTPCEAAYLSSARGVKVRVLCSPTNTAQIRRIYSRLPNVEIEELRINESDLNTRRMLDLMAVNSFAGNGMPLYMSVINRILRELRVEQQTTLSGFKYSKFKCMIDNAGLTEAQLAPLQQRLETLESFMVQQQALAYPLFKKGKQGPQLSKNQRKMQRSIDWTAKPGQLTIVDLSCPCMTAEMACSLFGICLSLFVEHSSETGCVVALDEAHKFMTNSAECQSLTESLLATIRLQRHLGARIIISTQEPTISPRLLDLCSITIVHRFTSPDWLATLKQHLAGASSSVDVLKGIDDSDEVDDLLQFNDDDVDETGDSDADEDGESDADEDNDSDVDEYSESDFEEDGDSLIYEHSPPRSMKYVGIRPLSLQTPNVASGLFEKIVSLRTGEALMFAPNAIIGFKGPDLVRLGPGVLNVRIRRRVTQDGGRSVLAA